MLDNLFLKLNVCQPSPRVNSTILHLENVLYVTIMMEFKESSTVLAMFALASLKRFPIAKHTNLTIHKHASNVLREEDNLLMDAKTWIQIAFHLMQLR